MVLFPQGLLARLPSQRAETTTLESLKNTDRLFNATTDIQVMDYLILDDTFRIDDEKPSQRDPLFRIQNSVGAGCFLIEVSQDRIPEFPKITSFDPGKVRPFAVS